jgi:carbonic anhydrase
MFSVSMMRQSMGMCLLAMAIHSTMSQTWNYGDLGPDVWKDISPECGQRSQSPINIRTLCTTYREFPLFQFSAGYNKTWNFTLINDGSTIDSIPIGVDAGNLKLNGGGLNGTFDFLEFHPHWGENYRSGSEHQMYV